MIDEYDDYDDYEYEKKPIKEKLKYLLYGGVVAALAVALSATAISRFINKNGSYGRIVVGGELYETPTYEEGFAAISYETIHPELATETSAEVIPEVETDPDLEAANTEEGRRQKAMESILKIDKDYVSNLMKQHERYKVSTISDTSTVTSDPNVVTPVNVAEGNVDYYPGSIAAPIYLDPRRLEQSISATGRSRPTVHA